jgi:hypothetical protein
MFEGSEMAEDDPVTDWATATGTSPLRVKITLDSPMQKFWLWQHAGQYDLGSEELDGRSRDEMWQSLSRGCPELGDFGAYRLYVGQDEVNWSNLRMDGLVIVPTVIPVIERGRECAIVNHNTVKRPREVGRLTVMTYQIFTIEKTPFGEPVQILAPNEITLSQLVAYFILPTGIQLDVGSIFYWNPEEVPDPSRTGAKTTIVEIPDRIPLGFNLRVKCNTLHENSSMIEFAVSPFVAIGD